MSASTGTAVAVAATPALGRFVTRDDVHRAADELLMARQRPTIEKIRQHLGRGSPNTIGPHLTAWFEQLHQRITEPQRFAAQHSVPPALLALAQPLWEAALADARAQAADALEPERRELKRAQDDLAAREEAFAQERRVIEARLEAFQESQRTLQAQLGESARAQDELLALLRQREADLAVAVERQGALEQQHAALQQLLASERTQHRDSTAALQARAAETLAAVQLQLEAATTQAQERAERLRALEAERVAEAGRQEQTLGKLTRGLEERAALLGAARQQAATLQAELDLTSRRGEEALAQAQQRERLLLERVAALEVDKAAALERAASAEGDRALQMRELVTAVQRIEGRPRRRDG